MKEEIKNEREKYKEELLKKDRERPRNNFLDKINFFENSNKKEVNISNSGSSFGNSFGKSSEIPKKPSNRTPAPYNMNPFQQSYPSLSELEIPLQDNYLNIRQNQEQINLLRMIANSINRNLRYGTIVQIILLSAFIIYFICFIINFYIAAGFNL